MGRRRNTVADGLPRIFADNSESIGRTPLVRLNRLAEGATILAKIEGRNPACSIKCRIGAAMIWDAEERGVLKPGMEIVEATSGNTGIALAFVAAARGYHLTLTMPESMSLERRKILKVFGANLILTEAAQGMRGAIAAAQARVESDGGRFFSPRQFHNEANPKIHETTTGPELWDDTGGELDVFVAGVGTGGTLTGVSRYFKKTKQRAICSVAVEPAGSPVITQTLSRRPLKPGPHAIQGIGAGFVPPLLDLALVDRVEMVSDEEALETARRLARDEGILSGISGGATVAAALRLAREPEFAGRNIVAVIADSAERYLSSPLFADQFQAVERATASEIPL